MAEAIPGGGAPRPDRVEGLDNEKWGSWLVPGGKDDEDFKRLPDEIQRQIRFLAKRPDSMLNQAALEKTYDFIDGQIASGNLTDAEAALWQARIAEKHQELGTSQEKGLGKELAEAIHGKVLTQDEKYLEMLSGEEWNNEPPVPIDARSAPDYFVDMIHQEKEDHKLRLELDNNAYRKRNGLSKPTLEALSAEIQWAGFEKGETKRLYETPGVRKAMEKIAQLATPGLSGAKIFRRADGSTFTIFTAKSKEEVQIIREYVREEIAADVAADFKRLSHSLNARDLENWRKRGLLDLDTSSSDEESQNILKLKCRDAEQIAFNLLYLGGFFESIDSQWEYGRRIRAPQITSALVHPVIKDAMNPLDALIDVLGRDPSARPLTGTIDKWANTQTLVTTKGKKLEGVNNVIILDEDDPKNKNRFWTLGDGGKTLYVAECYPTKLVRSVWEETTTETSHRTLLSYLLNGEEIPWNDIKGENMWGSYGSKLGKAGQTLVLLQGGLSIRWGEYENVRKWAEDVDNALAKFGRKQETGVKRWILYASSGIDPNKRPPTLNNAGRRLDILGNLGPSRAGYLSTEEELLFPWDRFGRFF